MNDIEKVLAWLETADPDAVILRDDAVCLAVEISRLRAALKAKTGRQYDAACEANELIRVSAALANQANEIGGMSEKYITGRLELEQCGKEVLLQFINRLRSELKAETERREKAETLREGNFDSSVDWKGRAIAAEGAREPWRDRAVKAEAALVEHIALVQRLNAEIGTKEAALSAEESRRLDAELKCGKAVLALASLREVAEKMAEALGVARNQFRHAANGNAPGRCIDGCAHCYVDEIIAAWKKLEGESK